ncbi:MAG TPA: hypothetical protein VFJ43_16070 [Bacteroidia bacterium]|nr:hypothetical protein [Bacteroidia bacterium]
MKKIAETIPPDTGAVDGEIPQGIIYVRKPHISPFIKVDYNLYLAHVNPRGSQREVPVTDKSTGFTDIQIETIPTFDSTIYSKKLKREYPVSAHLLSKYYAENMKYEYQENDTPRVDTMVVGMWIDSRGKIKRVLIDTEFTSNMPHQLVDEIAEISYTISDWGTGGGYLTQKKFLKPSKLVLESYYCEAYIIVSSYPLTKEQKKTGTSYAPFDYPLNSPALDRQQKLSVDENAALSHKGN